MTLAEFLLARIAEDERDASDRDGEAERWPSTGWDEAVSKRAHAECEAKRQLVELHSPVESGAVGAADEERSGLRCPVWGVHWPCRTLRLLALPYADHPDYDEAWAV